MLYSDAEGAAPDLAFERDDLRVVRERASDSEEELLESWSTSTKFVCVVRLGAALEGGREVRRVSVWIVVLERGGEGWGGGGGGGRGAGAGGEGLRSSMIDCRVMRTSRRGGGEGERRTTRRTRVTRAGIGASSSFTLMRHMVRGCSARGALGACGVGFRWGVKVMQGRIPGRRVCVGRRCGGRRKRTTVYLQAQDRREQYEKPAAQAMRGWLAGVSPGRGQPRGWRQVGIV